MKDYKILLLLKTNYSNQRMYVHKLAINNKIAVSHANINIDLRIRHFRKHPQTVKKLLIQRATVFFLT